mgnify:CR=1 FL=1
MGVAGSWVEDMLSVSAAADASGQVFVSGKRRADRATSRLHFLDGAGHAWACMRAAVVSISHLCERKAV